MLLVTTASKEEDKDIGTAAVLCGGTFAEVKGQLARVDSIHKILGLKTKSSGMVAPHVPFLVEPSPQPEMFNLIVDLDGQLDCIGTI